MEEKQISIKPEKNPRAIEIRIGFLWCWCQINFDSKSLLLFTLILIGLNSSLLLNAFILNMEGDEASYSIRMKKRVFWIELVLRSCIGN